MRYLFSLFAALLLASCAAANPAKTMTAEQISTLKDAQICHLANYYQAEANTMLEIARRGISCDLTTTECMKRGVAYGSDQMPLCSATVRAEWMVQNALVREQARRDWVAYERHKTRSDRHHHKRRGPERLLYVYH